MKSNPSRKPTALRHLPCWPPGLKEDLRWEMRFGRHLFVRNVNNKKKIMIYVKTCKNEIESIGVYIYIYIYVI